MERLRHHRSRDAGGRRREAGRRRLDKVQQRLRHSRGGEVAEEGALGGAGGTGGVACAVEKAAAEDTRLV